MNLQDITVADILDYLANNSYDTHLGWLDRAAQSAGDPPAQDFLDMVEMELAAVRVLLPKGDEIKIYRGLNNTMDERKANIHWTESYAMATQHGKFVYTAVVPSERVDWLATVVRRISWPREQEISLFPGFIPESARYGAETSMRLFMDIVGGAHPHL